MKAGKLETHLNNPILAKELIDKLPSQAQLGHARPPITKENSDWLYQILEEASTVEFLNRHYINQTLHLGDDGQHLVDLILDHLLHSWRQSIAADLYWLSSRSCVFPKSTFLNANPVAFLDIEGAFDNFFSEATIEVLTNLEIKSRLVELINQLLKYRTVASTLDSYQDGDSNLGQPFPLADYLSPPPLLNFL
ncbi:hypothetical protein ACLKA7_001470 [Drosophila subpalustris]